MPDLFGKDTLMTVEGVGISGLYHGLNRYALGKWQGRRLWVEGKDERGKARAATEEARKLGVSRKASTRVAL